MQVPDLIFSGTVTPNRRRVYIAWRLMSEAVTMSMADMVELPVSSWTCCY